MSSASSSSYTPPPPSPDDAGCIPVVAAAADPQSPRSLSAHSPGAHSPSAPRVRFEDECVLIPEQPAPPRLPRLVRKSYSVALWRKKSQEFSSARPEFLPDEHVVLKVSVPSLTRSCSPIREHHPLTPCIVTASPRSPDRPRPARRASSPSPARSPADRLTVPLRACCAACVPATDDCVRSGDAWVVHFTRGARRLHATADASPRPRDRVCDAPGFHDVLAVDEVDRKRAAAPLPTQDALEQDGEFGLLPSISRGRRLGPAATLQGVAEEGTLPPLSGGPDAARGSPTTPSDVASPEEHNGILSWTAPDSENAMLSSDPFSPDAPEPAPARQTLLPHTSSPSPTVASAPIPILIAALPRRNPEPEVYSPVQSLPSPQPLSLQPLPSPRSPKLAKSASADAYFAPPSPGARRRQFAQLLAGPGAILRASAGVLTSLSSGMGGGTALSV